MALAHVGPANLPADERPSGPNQKGRGIQGQYVYWLIWAYPSEWAVQTLGLASPDSMSRVQFSEAIVQVQCLVLSLMEHPAGSWVLAQQEPHKNPPYDSNPTQTASGFWVLANF